MDIHQIVRHDTLPDMPSATLDNHTLYPLVDGTRGFTGVVGGIFPTTSSHLATKEYVDSAITFIEEYFFTDTLSNIGGIYFDMIDMPTGEAESEHSTSGITNTNDQPLVNFATIAGVPGLITLDAGIYAGNIHALKSGGGQRTVKIYYEIHTREADSPFTETLLVTSEESEFLTVAEEHYTLHATLTEDAAIATTDRIIIKWFANGGTGGGNATVLLRQEGSTSAHLNVPISSNILSQIYLRQDGAKPLTDDWPIGFFGIENISTLGGGVDPAAITDLSEHALWSFEGDRTAVAGGSGSPPTLAISGAEAYCDRGTTQGFENAGSTVLTATGYKGILGTNARTYNFWVKLASSDAGNIAGLFATGDFSTGGKYFSLRKRSTDDALFLFFGNGNVTTNTNIADDTWHMVTIVVPDSATYGDILIYLDAVDDTLSGSNLGTSVTTEDGGLQDDMVISADNALDAMVGCIDEFAVFDKGLTPTEITNIYNRQLTDHITITGGLTLGSGLTVGDGLTVGGDVVSGGSGTFPDGIIITGVASILPVGGDTVFTAAGDMFLVANEIFLDSNNDIFLDADEIFLDADSDLILDAAENIFLDLGDSAGNKKVSIRDSGSNIVATIDSNGGIVGTSLTIANGTLTDDGGNDFAITALVDDLNLKAADEIHAYNNINMRTNDLINVGVISIREQASANADVANRGQLWTKDNAGTTELWFTDDNGNDNQIAYVP